MITEQPLPRLRVLGGFQLLVGNHPTPLPVQAQRLLGLLAVRWSLQTRSALAGTLWDDVPERRAQANLRNAVWRIRLTSDAVLRCTRHAIGLDTALALDLHEAQRCAQALLSGAGAEPDGRLIDVLDHDLLPAWDEEWLVIERERQRQLRMHALEALSASLRRVGRYPEAITAALAAVRAEPLRESAQRALILAHLGEGNVSEAVRQLDAYRQLLDGELGIAPSEQLEAIVRQGIANQPMGATRRPEGRKWGAAAGRVDVVALVAPVHRYPAP
ncbi:MAG: AfsR/SARP family transcriptional regulator [Pseudonocardiales bacterium]